MNKINLFLSKINRQKLGLWSIFYFMVVVVVTQLSQEINKTYFILAMLPFTISLFIGNISYFIQNPNDKKIRFAVIAVTFGVITSIVFFAILVVQLFS